MQAVNNPALSKPRLWQELCESPLWRPEDLGRAIPRTPHATSVAMPLWEHVVGYERKDPAVIDVMETGYPRFVFNKHVQALLNSCEARYAGEGEKCLVFPSEQAAAHCAEFLRKRVGCQAVLTPISPLGATVVVVPEDAYEQGRKCWQHYGRIVTSRLADAVLEERTAAPGSEKAKAVLKARIAGWVNCQPEHVFLYPTGMAALADCLRTVQTRTPGARTAQIGFPYVDLLKIQSFAEAGVAFFSALDDDAHEQVLACVRNEPIAGVFCECPGNPMLSTPDLARLSGALRDRGVPLVVDETLASYANIDLTPYADLIVTSLTKFVSGVGDVMAGGVIVNPESPMADELHAALSQGYEDTFWDEDAAALEENSRDFPERMHAINRHAEAVCDFLAEHPAVDRVLYPKFAMRDHYDALRKPNSGYSGLFSVTFKGGAEAAERFYNRLRVSKGPSLGMNFTMACPFVILAHFDELDWAASHGVPVNLVRVSIGLEEPEDLIGRFEEALAK